VQELELPMEPDTENNNEKDRIWFGNMFGAFFTYLGHYACKHSKKECG